MKKAPRLTRQQVRREIDRLTNKVGEEVVTISGVDTIHVALVSHPTERFEVTVCARHMMAMQQLEQKLAWLRTMNLKRELIGNLAPTEVVVKLSSPRAKSSPVRSVREQRMHFRP